MNTRRLAAFALCTATGVLAGPVTARAACSVTSGDFDGNGTADVRILGDAQRQNLTIEFDAASVLVQLDCNGNGVYTDPGDFTATYPDLETFDVQLKGKDTIVLVLAALRSADRKQFELTLGPGGNDVELITLGPTVLQGQSSWVFDVVGGPNDDTLRLNFGGAVNGSLVQVRGDLAAGNDHVVVAMPPGSSSNAIDLDLALGPGNNTFDVSGSGNPSGVRWNVGVEGGDAAAGSDRVGLNLRSPLVQFVGGSRVAFNANLLAGNDAFTAAEPNMFSGSEYRVRVKGGAGNDVLQSGTLATSRGSSDGLIETVFDGGAGNDVIEIEKAVEGIGTYRVRAQGGEGADVVVTSIDDADVGFGLNVLDCLSRGGRGADTVYAAILAPAGASYGPDGAALLDGGADAGDICISFGTGTVQRLACESGS